MSAGAKIAKKKGPEGTQGRLTIINQEKLRELLRRLLFVCFAVGFPGTFGGAQRESGVRVFQREVVVGVVIRIQLEQVGDPVAVVVAFQLQEQVERQLVGRDVVGNGQEVAVPGIEGE